MDKTDLADMFSAYTARGDDALIDAMGPRLLRQRERSAWPRHLAHRPGLDGTELRRAKRRGALRGSRGRSRDDLAHGPRH